MASAELSEAIEPKKNRNFRFAFTCAIFASMACIILGYGTYTFCSYRNIFHFAFHGSVPEVLYTELLLGRHRSDEWSGDIHQEGPQDHGRAAGDPDRRPQPLLAHRVLRGRADVRLDGPPLHRGLRRRHFLHGGASHGVRRQLRHAHGRALRGRRRRGLRGHDRARVHRRGIAGVSARLPDVVPGGVHQLRHPAGVRVQLRVRAPPALPRLAGHARHRRGAVRPARVHGVRHARVVPVARHEGPPRGRQGRTGEDD
jgi:hypothetical protein